MKWVKPNGTEIETNDMKATITYCKSLGWDDITREPEFETGPDENAKSDAELAGYPPEPKPRKKPGPKPKKKPAWSEG